MEEDILYNDNTKLRDLTVGQLKDIIIEVLSRGLFTRFEPERRTYRYEPGYYVTPNTIPTHPEYEPYPPKGPYCEAKGETC